MSGWEDFKTDAEKVASKVAQKTEELTDSATARFRLEKYKLKLCEEYEKLGKAVYKAEKEARTPDIGEAIERIDVLKEKISVLKKKIKSTDK